MNYCEYHVTPKPQRDECYHAYVEIIKGHSPNDLEITFDDKGDLESKLLFHAPLVTELADPHHDINRCWISHLVSLVQNCGKSS